MIRWAPLTAQGLPTAGRQVYLVQGDDRVLLWSLSAAPTLSEAWREVRRCRAYLSLPRLVHERESGGEPPPRFLLGWWVSAETFESFARRTVCGTYEPSMFDSKQAWRLALRFAQVRHEWVSDVGPVGELVARQTAVLTLARGVLDQLVADRAVLAEQDCSAWWKQPRAPGEPFPVVRAWARSQTWVT